MHRAPKCPQSAGSQKDPRPPDGRRLRHRDIPSALRIFAKKFFFIKGCKGAGMTRREQRQAQRARLAHSGGLVSVAHGRTGSADRRYKGHGRHGVQDHRAGWARYRGPEPGQRPGRGQARHQAPGWRAYPCRATLLYTHEPNAARAAGNDIMSDFKKLFTWPSWCNAQCSHLRTHHRHKRPDLPLCTWRLPPGRWCLGRLDRLTSCPLEARHDR